MWPLGRTLKRDRRPPVYFTYPSRRHDIPDNAERLARFLRARGPGPFDVVTHSLGAVVLRWAATHHDLPRLRRVVMIAPPNRGCIFADRLHRKLGPVFTLIYGQTGLQLRRGRLGLADRAGLPVAQIGVIAGGTGTPKGFNRFLPGDNDHLVVVEETILAGMKDFVLVNHHHSSMLWARDTAELTLRFLRTGRFRQPPIEVGPER
jgi:pimeloyl-ACP methyl ester carboxylesterase